MAITDSEIDKSIKLIQKTFYCIGVEPTNIGPLIDILKKCSIASGISLANITIAFCETFGTRKVEN